PGRRAGSGPGRESWGHRAGAARPRLLRQPRERSRLRLPAQPRRAGALGGAPRSQTVQAPGLIWSPNTVTGSAETVMVAQIDAARHAVDFESEELSAPPAY